MKEQFRAWFEVVYRDNPERADEIVAAWHDVIEDFADEEYFADETMSWHTENVFSHFLLHDEVMYDAHLFAIDWKDTESLMAYLDDFAERFDFEFHWTDENRERDTVENLLPLAVAPLNKRGVLLYSLETGGDLYYFVAVPQADKRDFERASEQWGLGYTLL